LDENAMRRVLRLLVLFALCAAWVVMLHRVHDLARHRHFTIDEWQYGHATWLVGRGEVPYRDFYEHHVPLSYVLHAPLLADEAPFPERALRLRSIVFAWIASLSVLLGAATFAATRRAPLAVLTAFVPFGFGFGLLSVVDYRADNFAAFLFLAALALVEVNRSRDRRDTSLVAGVLLGLALWTTQKMVYVVGGTGLALAVVDLARWRAGARPPFVARPGALLLGLGATLAAGIAALAASGVLVEAFEITVLHAVAHEAAHPPMPLSRFAAPFLASTPITTPLFALGALLALATPHGRFWLLPLAVAAASGAAIRAQFPYNYVLACLLLGIAALAGFAWVVERAPLRGRLEAARPLLWLLPLLVLPEQIGFTRGVSDNRHQLALLEAVERFTGPDDVVIDGAGGALFRPHASYWWYHGGAHRRMLPGVFSERLLEDYRRSAAPLWIRDLRLQGLPQSVRDFFASHYVRVDGDLYALGFRLPPGGDAPRSVEIDVLRAGDWNVFAAVRGDAGHAPGAWLQAAGRPSEAGTLHLERGREAGTLHLERGRQALTVAPGAPALLLSPLPRALFYETRIGDAPHSPTFEYGQH
jgi:hypothetical protein